MKKIIGIAAVTLLVVVSSTYSVFGYSGGEETNFKADKKSCWDSRTTSGNNPAGNISVCPLESCSLTETHSHRNMPYQGHNANDGHESHKNAPGNHNNGGPNNGNSNGNNNPNNTTNPNGRTDRNPQQNSNHNNSNNHNNNGNSNSNNNTNNHSRQNNGNRSGGHH